MRVKSLSFLFAMMLFLSTYVYSGDVNLKSSGDVAKNFYFEQVAVDRGIGYDNVLILDHYTSSTNSIADYRVFNFQQGGWVIVSADDIVKPVLAYSPDGYYDPTNVSPTHKAWMEQYQAAIAHYRLQGQSDISITSLWNHYLTNSATSLGRPATRADVAPFMKSHWGQGKYYNAMCPSDAAGEDGHALVGCVATSVSQVMYYYRFPAQGQGSHGYYANNSASGYGDYGWLSVNFGNTTYDWEGMSDQVNGTNANLAAAELCYHAGVGVDMAYGAHASGSQTSYAADALKTYFKYTTSIQFLQRYQYSATSWDNSLKNNLNGKKPIIYSGVQPAGSGHAWVFDGYDTTNQGTFFHCNWGWDGMSDGYFSIDALGPGSEPPFSAYQGAVVNIYPSGSYPGGCGSTKTVTSRTGSLTDGSGPANYTENSDCYWLLSPADSVENIYMNFDYFDVADDNDVLTIYDGTTTSAAVLGTFTLSNPPSSPISSTSSKVLVRFVSDGSGNSTGWQLSYKGSNPDFCGNTTITAASGSISDGSGTANYSTNTTCTWRIEPPGGNNLTLSFTSFDVSNGDYINVYDWGTQTLLLTKYSGNTPPPDITAPSGSAYIEFKSDWNSNGSGWEANYTVDNVGVEENSFANVSVYPVPAKDRLMISFDLEGMQNINLRILDITGKVVIEALESSVVGTFNKTLDISKLAQGVYILRARGENGTLTRKITVE